MEKTIARLFRDPETAQKIVGELLAKGYKQEEIGVLLRLKEGRRLLSLVGAGATQLTLSKVGEVTALGALAKHISKEETDKALAKAIGATADTYGYYEFGLSTGGVLVTVHGEEAHLDKALRLLRSPSAGVLPIGKSAPNPGFNKAARMSATDPMDAKMTGDFRRY
ncbi:MAG: hypothetical protein Q7R34_04365 [Dehalococcoidia bacterium]|nr:hypothetical protein [Dehalococcoidia bacterium]